MERPLAWVPSGHSAIHPTDPTSSPSSGAFRLPASRRNWQPDSVESGDVSTLPTRVLHVPDVYRPSVLSGLSAPSIAMASAVRPRHPMKPVVREGTRACFASRGSAVRVRSSPPSSWINGLAGRPCARPVGHGHRSVPARRRSHPETGCGGWTWIAPRTSRMSDPRKGIKRNDRG